MNKTDINMLKRHARRCLRIILQNMSIQIYRVDFLVELNTTHEELTDMISGKDFNCGLMNKTIARLRLKGVKDYFFSQELFDALKEDYSEFDASYENAFLKGQLYLIGRLLEGHDKSASIILSWGSEDYDHFFKYHFKQIKPINLT